MRNSNIISILNAYKNLPPGLFESYLNYHSIKIKNDELDDLEILKTHLVSITNNIEIFDKYFIGYSIPQIGKEFDLLRIDSDSVVNIELKSRSTPEDIKKQLRRNKYYLSFLKKEIHNFTYVSEKKELYGLDENGDVLKLNIRQLIAKLASQSVDENTDINSLFNPTNYLVSPFNSTLEFIKEKYFLTNHQEQIKKNALKQINAPGYSILAIKGKAGTGKTLLTYDIANHVYKSSEVLIIHCGILNQGHITLRDDFAWRIIPAKSLFYNDVSKYHLIIVDEAQRIYPNQLEHLVKEIKAHSKNCIFSYDRIQTLKGNEIRNNMSSEIEKHLITNPFELTTKIRTNKEVAFFIKCLLNKSEGIHQLNYSNIKIHYFEDYPTAKQYLISLKSQNWKIINYTPSTVNTLPYEQFKVVNESDNAHTVIGQEFDNVVAVIDKYFYYDNKDKLSTKGYKVKPYYHPSKMLFQILSRTKMKLSLVIIKNHEILKRCLDIMVKNTNP